MLKIYRKTLVAFAVVALITAGLVGAWLPVVSASAEDATKEKTELVIGNEFTIGAWIQFYDTSITPYDEQVRELARSGMNLSVLPSVASGVPNSSVTSPVSEYLKDESEFYKELDAVSRERNFYYMYYGTGGLNFAKSYEIVKNLTNCVGYHLVDEPGGSVLDSLGQTVRDFKEGDPSRIPFVNLFPSYAGTSNLGGTYREYVEHWVNAAGAENMEYLHFDHYPFPQSEDVRGSYFGDLEVIRDVAYKNGKMKTGGFTQMGSWNGMRRPTESEARWSIYSLVTYGLKTISHFNWVAPAYVSPSQGGEGMNDFVTDVQGNPTELFEPVSILNWQLRQLGDILMNIDVKHAYHTYKVPSGAEKLSDGFPIKPSDANADFIYSIAYSKDTNEPYLMVFNKALTGSAVTHEFTVNSESGIESVRYFKPTDYTFDSMPDPTDLENTLLPPEEIVYTVTNGKFSDTFLPGEMKLYKLEGDDLVINEDFYAPECSHTSGVYGGVQTVSLSSENNGAEIYYTLDGSFPYPGKSGTLLYGEPFELGEAGKTKTYCVRAVCVRGGEVSDVSDTDIIIGDSEGVDLIADTENWAAVGGGTWSNDGSQIADTTPFQTSNWNKSYSYNGRTYSDFVIDADITANVSSSSGGYLGVQIFREDTSVQQGDNTKGLLAAVDFRGRGLLWDGMKEHGPDTMYVSTPWNLGTQFNMKIVSYKGLLAMSVDGVPVLCQRIDSFARREGYVSIVSGFYPITVTKFTIAELDDEFEAPAKTAAVKSCIENKLAVERFVSITEVARTLGNSAAFTGTDGKTYTLGVKDWVCDEYDRTKTGTFVFTADIDESGLIQQGLSGVYNVKAVAEVFVRSEVDTSEVEKLIALAATLSRGDYTYVSWEALEQKLSAARDLINNKFYVQSDINVGLFQLHDAIYALEFTGSLSGLRKAIAQAELLEPEKYTDYTYAELAQAVASAKEYLEAELKTSAGVNAHIEAIEAAESRLTLNPSSIAFSAQKPNVSSAQNSGGCSGSVQASCVAFGALALALGSFLLMRKREA